MSKIVTFGEIMLRLAPNGYYRFFQDDQFQATFGGAEANVAVSLANFGENVAFVTKLPNHARLRSLGSLALTLRISAVVVRVLESIIWRKAQASAEVFVFMIERVLQYRLQAEEILTGVEYLREQNGFILPELLRL